MRTNSVWAPFRKAINLLVLRSTYIMAATSPALRGFKPLSKLSLAAMVCNDSVQSPKLGICRLW